MIRKIDSFGRIVIPAEIRRQLLLSEGDYLMISVSDQTIMLHKFHTLQGLERNINDLEKIVLGRTGELNHNGIKEYDFIQELLKHLEAAKLIAAKIKALE